MPVPPFLNEADKSIKGIIVSHRTNRKVQGPLHDETLYSPRRLESGKRDNVHGEFIHIRKPVYELSFNMIKDNENGEGIVDKDVRKRVQEKYMELGGNMDMEKKKAEKIIESLKNNLPFMKGNKVPIKKVRVRIRETAKAIGHASCERYIQFRNNHHVEIFKKIDKKQWKGEVVTRYVAFCRIRAGEPIFKREREVGEKNLFSLSHGECVKMKDKKTGEYGFYVVSKFSQSEVSGQVMIHFVRHNDARLKTKEVYVQMGPESLRAADCKKVVITPLGKGRWAND